jgi:hypothetical protein
MEQRLNCYLKIIKEYYFNNLITKIIIFEQTSQEKSILMKLVKTIKKNRCKNEWQIFVFIQQWYGKNSISGIEHNSSALKTYSNFFKMKE